jgi:hypothetical protein
MGIWSHSKVDDDTYDIDKWLGEADEDYCYTCQDWVETKADEVDVCKVCNNHIDAIGDDLASPYTAKTAIGSTPMVSSHGDMWGRGIGGGYTWGGGRTTWWNRTDGVATSSMWGGLGHFGIDNNAKRLMRHKGHLDSLCKVLDPTVKHSLTFASHRTAQTNMITGEIVIDGSLLKKNDDFLDIASGLAIHEKLHLIHSRPLLKWESKTRADMESYGERELLHTIGNIVEDEFIERQLHKTAAGFVTYIEAVKKHYFEGKIEEISGTKDMFGDIINTLLLLVRYPSLIDADRRKRHAPHIRFFAKALKKGIDSRDDTYMCIQALFDYLKKTADKLHEKGEPDLDSAMAAADERVKDMKARFAESGVDITAKDWEEIKAKIRKEAKEGAIKKHRAEHHDPMSAAFDELRRMWKELTEYDSDEKLSSKMMKDIKELEDTEYEEYDMDAAIAVSNGQKKITWNLAKETDKIREQYKEDRNMMKVGISQLKKKIQLYGNVRKYTIRNQKQGRIDKRLLHRIPQGRMDLFKFDVEQTDKPLDICLLIDESGSMGYGTMSHARQGAIALKEALGDNPQLNLWVFGHSADNGEDGTTQMIEYASPRMKMRPMAMGGMHARYENRDGNAIVAATQRVLEQTDQPHANKLMIVLSDGSPSANNYRGSTAITHVRKCVKYVEGRSWSVIQLGFRGAYEGYMKQMFTNWAYVDDMDKLSVTVSRLIRKVLKI